MNYCHFVTKHFATLCSCKQGEDTINILSTNINGIFFYLKMTFFQKMAQNTFLHFVNHRQTSANRTQHLFTIKNIL